METLNSSPKKSTRACTEPESPTLDYASLMKSTCESIRMQGKSLPKLAIDKKDQNPPKRSMKGCKSFEKLVEEMGLLDDHIKSPLLRKTTIGIADFLDLKTKKKLLKSQGFKEAAEKLKRKYNKGSRKLTLPTNPYKMDQDVERRLKDQKAKKTLSRRGSLLPVLKKAPEKATKPCLQKLEIKSFDDIIKTCDNLRYENQNFLSQVSSPRVPESKPKLSLKERKQIQRYCSRL